MKNYILLAIIILLFGCEKENRPINIEEYLSGKTVMKVTTNPSGKKVFFLSGVIDPGAEPWRCSISYIYQLSCTDGEHIMYFENLHRIGSIAVDENCNLYTCIRNNIVKFTPPSDSVSVLNSSAYFSDIAADSSGNIWAGTFGDGLYCYANHVWNHYTSKNSNLSGNNISLIVNGTNNNTWLSVTGDTGSLTNISEGIFKTYKWSDLVGANVSYISHLAVDMHGVAWVYYYFNSGNNLVTISKDGVLTVQQPEFLSGKFVEVVRNDYKGNIFIATSLENTRKLYRYNGIQWNEVVMDIGDSHIFDVTTDSENNLWIGTQKGVIKTTLQLVTYYD